jgi:tetratricopeptide (TPR) repeat protein
VLGFAANTAIRVKMVWLEHTAYRAALDRHLDRAADLHARRASLAQTLNDTYAEADSVTRQAETLLRLGRLQEAMAVAAPALPDHPLAAHPATTMHALLVWLSAAVDLPVSLQTIQRLDKRAEDYLQSTGHPEWRQALLYERSLLLADRGEFSSALAAAQEAWALWRINHNIRPSAEDVLSLIAWLYCGFGNLVGARGCIEQLARQRNDNPNYRRYTILDMEFSISLAENRFDDTVQLAKQQAELARHWSKTPWGAGSAVTLNLIRGQVNAQCIHAARRNLVQIASIRRLMQKPP